MSWDVLVFGNDTPPPPVIQMEDKWRGIGIGILAEVRAKIDACIPGVDWSDPNWGIYNGDGYSFEFSIGKEEHCESISIHVRGTGDVLPVLLSLGKRWTWYLLDLSQGEWLHHCESPDAGWCGFQEYRDRMLAPFGPG